MKGRQAPPRAENALLPLQRLLRTHMIALLARLIVRFSVHGVSFGFVALWRCMQRQSKHTFVCDGILQRSLPAQPRRMQAHRIAPRELNCDEADLMAAAARAVSQGVERALVVLNVWFLRIRPGAGFPRMRCSWTTQSATRRRRLPTARQEVCRVQN